jgi:hypothetical protein
MRFALFALIPPILIALVVLRVVPRKTGRLPDQDKLDEAMNSHDRMDDVSNSRGIE